MHEVGADEMHVQFGFCGEPHVISHHAAGDDARRLDDAVIGHTEFLHVRQFAVAWQVGAGDGADFGHVSSDCLPSFLGQDVGRRHIYRRCGRRQHGLLECDQLAQRGDDSFAIRPLMVRVFVAIIGVRQYERLMVVAMVADFAVLFEQQSAEIAEMRFVLLPYGSVFRIVPVVFDHHAGETDAVPFREFGQVRPPDLRIEVGDAHAVVAFDVGGVSAGDRGWKIVQIERGAVDDRVCRGGTQQAERGGIEAAHHLAIDADIAGHGSSGTHIGTPDQWRMAIGTDRFDGGLLIEVQTQRRFERATEHVGVPATQHKVPGRLDAFGHHVVVCGGFDADLRPDRVQIACFFRRHGKHHVAAAFNPSHDGHQLIPQRIKFRHDDQHGAVPIQ